MKLLAILCTLFLAFTKINAQPNVLFLLPSENSVISSRVYNLFQEFYRGNSKWADENQVSKETINSYRYVVQLKEKETQYGVLTIEIYTYFGNSRGFKSGGYRFNSKFSQLSMYKLQILEITFDLIKDLDPEYYEEMKEIFEKLGTK